MASQRLQTFMNKIKARKSSKPTYYLMFSKAGLEPLQRFNLCWVKFSIEQCAEFEPLVPEFTALQAPSPGSLRMHQPHPARWVPGLCSNTVAKGSLSSL